MRSLSCIFAWPFFTEDVQKPIRHLSYEEFEKEYTEYKPPERYQQRESFTAADKIGPKVTIMVSVHDLVSWAYISDRLYISRDSRIAPQDRDSRFKLSTHFFNEVLT